MGLFISIEGMDGSGKSTFSAGLVARLNAKGISALSTREPGGTAKAEAIRKLLLAEGGEEPLVRETEILLLLAARQQHWQALIKPALAKGQVVITDRWSLSTFCYQYHGLPGPAVPESVMWSLSPKPDLTFILEVSSEEAKRRTRTRGEENRFDEASESFRKRVNEGLQVANQGSRRFVHLDAERPQEALQEQALKIIDTLL